MSVKFIAKETVKETTIKYWDYFDYLFVLQIEGATNMFGASTYLEDVMGLELTEARKLLAYWMKNYKEISEIF